MAPPPLLVRRRFDLGHGVSGCGGDDRHRRLRRFRGCCGVLEGAGAAAVVPTLNEIADALVVAEAD